MTAADDAIRHDLGPDEFAELFDAGRLSLELSPGFSVAIPPPPAPVLADPLSDEYHSWVMRVWSAITGRERYAPEVDEAFDIPDAEFLRRPWPYSSGSPTQVGQYNGAIAWLLRAVEPQPGERVVEYGAGWGLLALELAMLGCETTAVDLNGPSVELLRTRARSWGVPLDVAHAAFLDYELPACDLIVFYEAFHHCDRPFHLLDRCRAQLRPGGRVVFLADAIYDDFYCPWGVRPDGGASFMARHVGWLELGFERGFFNAALEARGFAVTEEVAPELGPYGTLTVATLPR